VRVFIYSAALYCEPCGEAIRERLPLPAGADLENESTFDSDDYPKGPYGDGGGEADTPQHCDACGLFLENPLTPHGVEFVREALRTVARIEAAGEAPQSWARDVWGPAYGLSAADAA
jgi:hypothetical protein